MENSNERYQQSFFRFEDLRIYHKSIEYNNWVHKAVNYFGDDSKLTLAVPFAKAAQAISLNIAEGSARQKQQFSYYLKLSKSSIRECVVYTTVAKELGFFSDEQEEESRRHLMELTKMIGALIASIGRSEDERANHQSQKHKEDIDFED